MASNLPWQYSLFVVYRSNMCSCGCGTKAKQQEWNAISFIWAAHSAPDSQEWYQAPSTSGGDRHGSFESLSLASPCNEYTKKRREPDLRSALLNPVCVIICPAQNGFSCGYSEFCYLFITLFLFSALLFKAAAAFIHHVCYWLNVSWPGGASSLVLIRYYGCILKDYSLIGSWSQEWWCHLHKYHSLTWPQLSAVYSNRMFN